MSDQLAGGSPIKIVTAADGRFQDVVLERSYLLDRVFTGAVQWSAPVVIHGENIEDDLHLLEGRTVRGQAFANIRDLPSFLRARRWQDRFGDLSLVFDLRNYRNLYVGGRAPHRAEELLAANADLERIVSLARDGSRGERRGTPTAARVSDFIVELDKVCGETPFLVTWPTKFSLFPAFLIAIWARRARQFPLVIAAPKSLSFGTEPWPNVRASVLEFQDLTSEVERVFGVEIPEVEKAYWVWQLSRGEIVEKERATTPRNISIDNARQFLRVLTRSRPDELRAERLEQRAAPVIFELNEHVLGLRHGHLPGDAPEVVAAAAGALDRQLNRVRSDLAIENLLPSAKGVFEVVGGSLSRVLSEDYDDGDIITIGIEMNSFQWHVESVRHDIGDASFGELIGLFSTSTLFLKRFRIWREYTGTSKASGGEDDGIAQFRLARSLLEGAKPAAILSPEAAQKVGVVLSRAPADNSPRELREGIVRSGENLAAMSINAASEILAKEASAFGGDIKKKVREEAAASIIKYIVKNADGITHLANLQNWRWANWVYELLKNLGVGGPQ